MASKLANLIEISVAYAIFEKTINIAKNSGKMILASWKTSSDEEKGRYETLNGVFVKSQNSEVDNWMISLKRFFPFKNRYKQNIGSETKHERVKDSTKKPKFRYL